MDKNNKSIIEFGLNGIGKLKEQEIAFEKEVRDKKEDLKNDIISNDFNSYLKELSYELAKEVIEQVRYVLNYKECEELKKGVLQEIKLRDCPILDGAYHFPVLNEMEFLSKDKIKKLDKYLAKPRLKSITLVGICRELEIKEDKSSDIIDYLLDKNIVENEYEIRCNECYYDTVIRRLSKKEYEKFKKIFEVSEKDLDEMTEEELDIYNNRCEDYIAVFCSNCDNEVFIDDLEGFKESVVTGVYFNIIAEPNRKYDNL